MSSGGVAVVESPADADTGLTDSVNSTLPSAVIGTAASASLKPTIRRVNVFWFTCDVTGPSDRIRWRRSKNAPTPGVAADWNPLEAWNVPVEDVKSVSP